MNLKKILDNEIKAIQVVFDIIQKQKNKKFFELCSACLKAIKNGNKVIFFGNGGSASDAQHLATELTVRYKKNRKAIAAMSLATDTSALTAIGNDFSFDKIFSRQIEALGKKGDIAIGITTSGNSKNIIEAFKQTKKKNIKFYGFSGNNGGKLKNYTKNLIIIPSKITSVVQVAEITLGQVLCDFLEQNAN